MTDFVDIYYNGRLCFAPDLVASRKRRIVIEIYGEKSSVRDASKAAFYKTGGFTSMTLPNEVADKPEYSKPIFQLLAIILGSDHPERLFATELAK
jgi:hypothetical protein